MWNHQPPSNSSSSSSQQQQPQQQQRQKKKVEWSTTLSSSDEPPPPPQHQQQQFNNHPHQQQQQHEENKSPGWDTESDHLLSYFLSSSNGGIASPNTDTQFVTTPPIPSSSGSFGLAGVPGGGSGTSPLPVVVGHGGGGDGGGIPQHQQQQHHQSQQQMMPPTAMRPSTYGKPPPQQPSSNLNPSLPSSSTPGPLAGPPPTAAMLGFVSGRGASHGHGGEGGRRSTMMGDDDDDNVKEDDDGFIQPPPTPAVQHYYPSSSSSASSSRNKMKTTINSGQRVVPAAAIGSGNSKSGTSLPNNAVQNMEGISPISPAAMIGPENHEPMVLPGQKNPPRPTPAAAAAAAAAGAAPSIGGVPAGGTGSAGTQQHPAVAELEARKSHMEWLKQINTLAQSSSGQAGTVGAAGVGQVQSAHLMAQQHHINQAAAATIQNPPPSLTTPAVATPGPTFGHSSVPFVPPGVPLHPAAAAVLASSGGNPMYFSHHAAAFLRQQASSSPVESEEKRAKRLERNRESARKSRLRKKVRLQTLEKQVNGLHNKIEKSRRLQINAMDITLGQVGKGLLDDLLLHLNTEESLGDYDGLALRPSLTALLEKMETPIRRDVVEFQYSTLGQYLCPRYQKFILWLFLHNEPYFLKGKEEYQIREAKSSDNSGDTKSSSSSSSSTTSGEAGKGQQKAKAAAATGKISSKQIGDEMTNGPKPENGTAKKKKALKRSDSSGGERLQLQAVAEDAGKMWPLTCFELSISVDQEEKVLLARKRVQNYEKFQHEGSQIAAASRMTSRLKEAVQYQLFVASYRKKKTFLDILTPRQAIKYQEWLLSNGDRCRQMLADDRMKVSPSPSPTPGDENVTLEDVCRNLEKVLKISKLEPSEM